MVAVERFVLDLAPGPFVSTDLSFGIPGSKSSLPLEELLLRSLLFDHRLLGLRLELSQSRG